MDTTKQYIKMCERAVGVQEYAEANWDSLLPCFLFDLLIDRVATYNWLPNTLRDRLGYKGNHVIISIESNNDGGIDLPEGTIGGVIWLPRQDQLQEMVNLEPTPLLLSRFHGWFKNEVINRKCLESMEQLWLAFVMKEKYGKTWDGETWSEPPP